MDNYFYLTLTKIKCNDLILCCKIWLYSCNRTYLYASKIYYDDVTTPTLIILSVYKSETSSVKRLVL